MRVIGGPLVSLIVLAALVFLAAPAAPAGPEATDAAVDVSNFQFTPSKVTIQSGEQVTWNWVSGTHSVETSDGATEWCGVRSSGSCSKGFPTPGTYTYRCGVHPSSMQATVVVEGESPQVAILTPTDGIEVEEAFTASGDASHTKGIETVEWRVDDGAFQPVDTLDLTTSTDATWSTLVPIDGLAVGSHTLTVRATATDGTTQTASITFQFAAPDAVDLRVTSLFVQNSLQSARISATLNNAGTVDVDGALLRFEYEYRGSWHEIDTLTVNAGAGKTLSRSATWDADGKIGQFTVRAVFDPEDAIAESDETNNARTGQATFGTGLLPGLDPKRPL